MRDPIRGGDGYEQFFFRGGLTGNQWLRQEVFYLAYHLHWSWSEIMNLDLGERRIYVQLLAERIEADNQAFEALSEQLRRS